ncbi:MAG TPA: thiamine phosphate synthase [Acidimicrobiales bacterium]|nr:thiamine phosphate synthase [Acidimicrobiales bacterium]
MSSRTADLLGGRRLYLCTPDRPDLERFLENSVSGGVDVVQLRDKSLQPRDLVARARLAHRVCSAHGVPFIVNDRPDVALAVGAEGVHVGQDDVPAAIARRILGQNSIVGLSTHSESELERSIDEPVDYISAGPVEETPTKPGRRGTGIGYVTIANRRSRRPVFITGAVTPEKIPSLWKAGARHFVVVRFITQSGDPRSASRQLRAVIDELVETDEID